MCVSKGVVLILKPLDAVALILLAEKRSVPILGLTKGLLMMLAARAFLYDPFAAQLSALGGCPSGRLTFVW